MWMLLWCLPQNLIILQSKYTPQDNVSWQTTCTVKEWLEGYNKEPKSGLQTFHIQIWFCIHWTSWNHGRNRGPNPNPTRPRRSTPSVMVRVKKEKPSLVPSSSRDRSELFDATIRQVVLMLLNTVQTLVCRSMMLLSCGRQTGRQVLNFENSTQSGSPILIYGYFDILWNLI